jgi:16S rRNA U516 pseudouridylate synthase RsuA-like enzyme
MDLSKFCYLSDQGRLDLQSEGLILLTNNGDFKRALELPVNRISRKYRVHATGNVSKLYILWAFASSPRIPPSRSE